MAIASVPITDLILWMGAYKASSMGQRSKFPIRPDTLYPTVPLFNAVILMHGLPP